MPLYDYQCPGCGHVEEKIVSFFLVNNHKDEFACPNPECDETRFMERLFSGRVHSVLRGPDFHRNSYDAYGPKDKE